MISVFTDSHANARLRAMKSRLPTVFDLPSLRAAPSASAFAAALHIEPPRRPDRIDAALFDGLRADYEKVLAHYRRGESLFRALLRLYEAENLKLAWRARTQGLPASRWTHLWKPLGRLETVSLSDWRDADSVADAVRSARGTPWERILSETLRAHEQDAAAAELAIERWAWASLVEEARGLPRRERPAAELVFARIRERDYDVLHRGVAFYRWTLDVAIASTVLLRTEEKPDALRAVARWTPDDGALWPHLPARLSRRLPPVADWDSLSLELRRQRREACRRAFRGSPFRLAPPVSYLMLKEGEVRALSALARSRERPEPNPALARALAGSVLEA